MSEHKQVTVEHWGDEMQVDEGLAKLLPLIWKLRVGTFNSCQEQEHCNGMAWIQFASFDDFKRFMNYVAKYPSEDEVFWETLYGRMVGSGSDDDWLYTMHIENQGVEETLIDDTIIEKHLGFNCFDASISVRFPPSDVPLLECIIEGILNHKPQDERSALFDTRAAPSAA